MAKKDPFVIPFCLWGRPTDTKAHISMLTSGRVHGYVASNFTGKETRKPFNVKHNGKVFSVGSGSAKQRFYFDNWSK